MGLIVDTNVFIALERRGDPIGSVLIVIEAVRLLAGVALRRRVRLVTPDSGEVPAALPAELNFEAAVALAENARSFLPGHGHRKTSLFGRGRRLSDPSPARSLT